MSAITLRGMTWNHPRGYAPLEATARAYRERHPHVQITWDRRSLKDFEDFPVAQLAAQYDLIVIDHPFVGFAAAHGPLLPLDQHLPADFLADQAAHAVGASHASYFFGAHQWALAIDAATPVACWRPDLLVDRGGQPPLTWDEVLTLARAGRVEVPAAPINCLMDFLGLCLAWGETPCAGPDRVVTPATGRAVLAMFGELLAHCEPGIWERNPIHSQNLLASAENTQVAYCLFPYGYSNYARPGYAPRRLTYGDLPTFRGQPLRSVLGGTGLAVSALRPEHRAVALDYARFTADGETQRTLYTAAGGQPGHRPAWLEPENNRAAGDYFAATLPALDRAWVRPRHAGYLEFQEKAGPVVQAALRGQLAADTALAQLDALHRAGLTHAPLRA